MKTNFTNITLTKDLNELIKNVKNIEIIKGNVSGNSIEVIEIGTNTQTSYVYYDKEINRNTDYNLLLEFIEKAI